ncbi:hypothetical protein BGZ95_012089 [Linnemannia exigua]|uniref:Uncharacterized protein n=1 Tax=Linnemannia exigua TaxID=604196 RepID=A0AAD4DB34_9FUNG|nr:hypothetical protein BGZ95_012089 [Linnemannia exigua]
MLTSRITYNHCAPFFYNTLEFEYSSHRLNILGSTLAKHAISRNAHYIQKLTVSQVDLPFLFNCLLAHECLQTRQSSSSPMSSTGMYGSFPPIYLPPPDVCPIEVVPICPMVNVTDLTLSLDHECNHRYSYYRVPSFDNSAMAVAQACWVISLSPHLLNLKIHGLVIKEHREVRLLGETIYERSRLRSLDLRLLVRGAWHREGWYKIGSTVVFSCPKSIQKLWIELVYIDSAELPTGSDEEEGHEMQLYHHHYLSHLHNLSFDFGDEDMDVSDDEEVDNDEDMGVVHGDSDEENEDADNEGSQGMDYEDEEETLEEDKEPSRALWSLRIWESQQCDEDELMSRPGRCEPLMELVDVRFWNFRNGITEDQLVWLYEHCCMVERLGISSFDSDIDPRLVANIIKTFCTRIKKLTFTEADSNAIRMVLSECVSLVNLQVNWDEDEVVSFVHLADAVAIPWASNKFTRLYLTIGLPRVQCERRQAPYYLRSPSCVLSLQEKGYFAQLETLYRQLASLQDLVDLDLRALQTRSKDMTIADPFYFENTFSAMLSLGDPRTGRPGFLELFGRWTKLKVLKGSFSVNTNETRETMGCLEATWMTSHWPLLEEAEFFQGSDPDTRESFEWLEKYRQHDDPGFSLGL